MKGGLHTPVCSLIYVLAIARATIIDATDHFVGGYTIQGLSSSLDESCSDTNQDVAIDAISIFLYGREVAYIVTNSGIATHAELVGHTLMLRYYPDTDDIIGYVIDVPRAT